MTSLSETYLSCKSAFANKLTNKGVSATSNDGLTTLINKIDNIPSGIHDNSLNLFADKKIDQSSNTINLYALLLRDGIAKAGETVNFYIDGDGTTYDSKVLTANTATTVSDRYSIDLPSTVTGYVYLEASKNILILYVNGSSSTDLTIYPTGGSPTIIYDVVSLVYANGVLTVTEDDDTVTEIDCSSYDMSSVTSTVTGVVIKDYGAKSATTNSGGIATIPYLCNGSGEHIVKAISGSVVSEPYEVIDAIFRDIGDTDNSSNWNLGGVGYTQSNDAVTLNNATGSTRWCTPKVNGSNISLDTTKDYCIEIDIKNVNCTDLRIILQYTSVYLHSYVSTSDFTHIKIYSSKSEGKTYYIVDGTTRSVNNSSTVSTDMTLRIANGGGYMFKNFSIYPI